MNTNDSSSCFSFNDRSLEDGSSRSQEPLGKTASFLIHSIYMPNGSYKDLNRSVIKICRSKVFVLLYRTCLKKKNAAYTHTHTHTYIYIYIYIIMYFFLFFSFFFLSQIPCSVLGLRSLFAGKANVALLKNSYATVSMTVKIQKLEQTNFFVVSIQLVRLYKMIIELPRK